MSGQLSSKMKRYQNPKVADHLASNYVMGLLNPSVRTRVDSLRRDYPLIDERIYYWENKFATLNNGAIDLAPLPQTWEHIQQRLHLDAQAGQTDSKAAAASSNRVSEDGKWSFSSWLFGRWGGGFSIAFSLMMAVVLLQQPQEADPLSYVAVLQNEQQEAQVVAASYGRSKNLVLDIISLPEIDSSESFELWVTSKTDQQVRSLGEVPADLASFERKLSDAEWRLITDSADLILSVEEAGGSAIGEPSDMIVSRGLCVRLSAWDQES
ncbi:anti-sigma factor domain-containing protein [Ningiella sp. W23]|uniref:anti-sigma factor n=1 Tax=Ningiella sp. W23 TaxID=3023715 RepID=UPI003757D7EA